MPNTYDVSTEITVQIKINDPEVIERVTGPGGDGWRKTAYDLHTADDVLEHLALNAIHNGVTDIRQLDGWADVQENAAEIVVVRTMDETFVTKIETPA